MSGKSFIFEFDLGNGGRWRWFLRASEGLELLATSPVNGFSTRAEAKAHSERVVELLQKRRRFLFW